jgi:hypothetical protein
MKFSLVSLIALALTSTSVMAAAQPVAVEKRAFQVFPRPAPGMLEKDVEKGRKKPRTDAQTSGLYRSGDAIKIFCYTRKDTTPVGSPLAPDS